MMKNQASREPMEPIAPELVPIVLIAIEVNETVDQIAHQLRAMVVLDDIGMRAVPADVARRFFAERAEQAAEIRRRQAESMRRLKELEASQPKSRGIPVPAGAPPDAALAILKAAENDDRDWNSFGFGEFTGGRR